ncbi:MAG: zinc finger domain-containing protein, partial [Rhodanobacteraceae bacterium]
LLRDLGPEPLGDAFEGDWLFAQSRGRSVAVKSFLMDQTVVVGIGNIYASEALFGAGVHPKRAAGAVSRVRYVRAAAEIRRVLNYAITRGGTTLRDFLAPDGAPGYFEQELAVYGRAGEPCRNCGTPIRAAVIGQRMSYWCPRCQR